MAGAIAKALKHMEYLDFSIDNISLYNNKISDPGAKALFEALRVNTTVIKIWLNVNSIGDASADAIVSLLENKPDQLSEIE